MNDKDLLGQADGLMRRHAVGGDTGAVPLLTDLIDAPQPPADALSAAPVPESSAEAEALEARIMAEVDRRLAGEMERVRREMAGAVADAVRQALANRPVK